MEERYVCTAPPDTLVCESHQLSQDKKEHVKEFAVILRNSIKGWWINYQIGTQIRDSSSFAFSTELISIFEIPYDLCFRTLNVITLVC